MHQERVYLNKIEIKRESLGIMPSSKIKISELFLTLSRALDIKNDEVLDHSRKVAYISLEIAEEYQLPPEDIKKLVLSALIHDIGFIDEKNKLEGQKSFVLNRETAENHSRAGYKILKRVSFLPGVSRTVYYHHHKWDGDNFDAVSGEDIPLYSRIIHLADRIEALVSSDECILFQIESVVKKIKSKSGSWFDPKLVDVFSKLAKKEYFWLNLSSNEYNKILNKWGKNTKHNINLRDLEEFASVTAHLIDRVSPFTARHSSGVATVAAMITHELGYPEREQRAMRIAGLFHDLGKLIISKDILEKKAQLSEKQFRLIKQHPYYTHRLLKMIDGLGNIAEWAALHHERLDGSGYPYHLKSEQLPYGSKIMAVSDIFQALTEDRPYRKAFRIEEALNIINDLLDSGKLDKNIVSVLEKII